MESKQVSKPKKMSKTKRLKLLKQSRPLRKILKDLDEKVPTDLTKLIFSYLEPEFRQDVVARCPHSNHADVDWVKAELKDLLPNRDFYFIVPGQYKKKETFVYRQHDYGTKHGWNGDGYVIGFKSYPNQLIETKPHHIEHAFLTRAKAMNKHLQDHYIKHRMSHSIDNPTLDTTSEKYVEATSYDLAKVYNRPDFKYACFTSPDWFRNCDRIYGFEAMEEED